MTLVVTFTDGTTFEASTEDNILATVMRYMSQHQDKNFDDIVSVARVEN